MCTHLDFRTRTCCFICHSQARNKKKKKKFFCERPGAGGNTVTIDFKAALNYTPPVHEVQNVPIGLIFYKKPLRHKFNVFSLIDWTPSDLAVVKNSEDQAYWRGDWGVFIGHYLFSSLVHVATRHPTYSFSCSFLVHFFRGLGQISVGHSNKLRPSPSTLRRSRNGPSPATSLRTVAAVTIEAPWACVRTSRVMLYNPRACLSSLQEKRVHCRGSSARPNKAWAGPENLV